MMPPARRSARPRTINHAARTSSAAITVSMVSDRLVSTVAGSTANASAAATPPSGGLSSESRPDGSITP
jgi:hypothetical protein